ncbi:MAG: RlmE family RNA methyltransferase [Desulfobacteraceae bacterium]|nr:RlmE family RNA methyltransferase [Desulfobacteraceae bacterium]
MKRPASKKNKWEDHYSRKAKKDRFPARSVYKLQEIQLKNNLIKKGNKVFDLGCCPGSWLLYAAELVGNRGLVVGIDLKPVTVEIPSNVTTYVGDIFSLDNEISDSIGKNFNAVISDMAPNTTGNKHVDAARSYNLSEAALYIARDLLVPGGIFVCKIFQGEGFKEYSDMVKVYFKKQKIFKPQSSRKASKEIYIIGTEKK